MDATGLPRPSPPSNVSVQRTGDSTNDVADGMQEVPQGGMLSAPTIRALTDDNPPIPVWHVVDHEKETEAPHLHDGPPGPPSFPRDFDGSFAKKLENELERKLWTHHHDNPSTEHLIMEASVASAAAMDPSMEGRVGEESVSSRGVAPPTSSHAADTAADLDLPSVGLPAFTAVGYRVAESDETPVYEGEISEPKAVLPIYQRTAPTDSTLVPVGATPKTSSPFNSLAPSSAPVTLFELRDFLQIGDWRIDPTCKTCSSSHLRISSQATGKTSQIFLNVGTDLPGGKSLNGFDYLTEAQGDYLTGGQGLTYSTQPVVFGDRTVQIQDWRIRQVSSDLLSVTNENGNVSRIYRSDGTVRGNAKEWGGYVIKDLGEPTCAYLTSSFLQIGEWRFGEMDDYSGRTPLSVALPRGFGHLSVTHRSGQTRKTCFELSYVNLYLMHIYLSTAMTYRDDGTIHPGPRHGGYNAWTLVDDEVLAGTKEGC
ncbi:hypothetical protein THAOC_31861 [Thalassiosira oceanica]|uniref:Uncharacterized protein n=1 Tax=Thalassiosira oceanica TaxID=159749 RepID=K0RAH8_THAOC|nr:hypothetical protein THAOC_31861 [Thalassiosira oceanica]|eukprot:EJK49284.1 hypothetical protein THAOC_31861 [Thalassiosira oceanica]